VGTFAIELFVERKLHAFFSCLMAGYRGTRFFRSGSFNVVHLPA
jgi:hypothetical protein